MASLKSLEEIEAGLEAWCPGRWRRQASHEISKDLIRLYRLVWRIELVAGAVRPHDVAYVLLGIDSAFPYSQPRVIAPNLGSEYRWPHVEQHGMLCLRSTSIVAPIADRIRLHLDDALELLNYNDDKCAAEFEREFGSYWSQLAVHPHVSSRVVCLVEPGGSSRKVVFYIDKRQFRVVVAETKSALKAWLRNTGTPVGDRVLSVGLLVRLERPWHPNEFPQTVEDAIRGLSDDAVRLALSSDNSSLFLYEASTQTGTVFAAVIASSARNDKLKNGFRSWAHVPIAHVKRATARQQVKRVTVSRADAAWIHGRGHSQEQIELNAQKVVIVGCGAVGSEIAELLAKAGVGELSLVDDDDLKSGNMSRHLLGFEYLGWNKAKAVANELQRRMPHLKTCAIYQTKFEYLTSADLGRLSNVDLIVAAGLSIEGEAALNSWRNTLKQPPAYLSAWVEAYAIVGHAVLLYGKDDLMSRFEGEQVTFRLTDWPPVANSVVVEAGCGNIFQPHGAVELQPTIAMAVKLAIDALLGRKSASFSCRRIWYGNREDVVALGGVVRDGFTEENSIRQISW